MPQSYRVNGWDEDYNGREWVYSRDCPNYDECGGTIFEKDHDSLCSSCRKQSAQAEGETK